VKSFHPTFKGIHFKTYGTKQKPALIFLHGFMGSGEDWEEIISYMHRDYYCITADLPGHGHSLDLKALGDVWSFNKLSQRLDALFSFLNLSAVNLVGYSMGGRIAIYYTNKYKSRVNRLVIESASPGLKLKNERENRLKNDRRLAETLRITNLVQFISDWYDQPVFAGLKHHPEYKNMVTRRGKNNRDLLVKSLKTFSTAKQPYLLNTLISFQNPLALFCGDKDLKFTELMIFLKKELPGSRLYIMKNCAHNSHFENPNLFAEHLKEFLSLQV
jgi:2-succinyl-6-hydroxy-2,4-cyclohexadiene-1-carboxylate synthase